MVGTCNCAMHVFGSAPKCCKIRLSVPLYLCCGEPEKKRVDVCGITRNTMLCARQRGSSCSAEGVEDTQVWPGMRVKHALDKVNRVRRRQP